MTHGDIFVWVINKSVMLPINNERLNNTNIYMTFTIAKIVKSNSASNNRLYDKIVSTSQTIKFAYANLTVICA